MSERIRLSSDGTMDTVLVCNECGQEARYTYMPDEACDSPEGDSEEEAEQHYEDFIAWAIEDFDSEHECPEPPDAADLGEL